MPNLSVVIRQRVIVSGRVQGVGFRYSCRRMAEGQGVSGWARNLADGRVEVCFEGPPDAVDRLVTWCHRGPSHADVTDVEVIPEDPRGERGFRLG
jgi:acylphosphatase